MLNHYLYLKEVRNNGISLQKKLDTLLAPNHTDATRYYFKHLDYSLFHPTSALIAKQELVINSAKDYPIHFAKNLKLLENSKEFKSLKDIIQDQINILYPKTQKARKYIIKNNRLSLDVIKHSKGFNYLDKIKILIKG